MLSVWVENKTFKIGLPNLVDKLARNKKYIYTYNYIKRGQPPSLSQPKTRKGGLSLSSSRPSSPTTTTRREGERERGPTEGEPGPAAHRRVKCWPTYVPLREEREREGEGAEGTRGAEREGASDAGD